MTDYFREKCKQWTAWSDGSQQHRDQLPPVFVACVYASNHGFYGVSLHAETRISTIPKSRDDQREENQSTRIGLPVPDQLIEKGISRYIFFSSTCTGLHVAEGLIRQGDQTSANMCETYRHPSVYCYSLVYTYTGMDAVRHFEYWHRI